MSGDTIAQGSVAGTRRLPAPLLWAGVLVTGAFGTMLYEEIERRMDPAVGYGDHVGVLVWGVSTSLLALAVSSWAARTGGTAARRTAVTMATLAVLTLPLFYWSGMPAALGLGAFLSVRDEPVEGAPRVAGITGAILALGLSVLSVVIGVVAPPGP